MNVQEFPVELWLGGGLLQGWALSAAVYAWGLMEAATTFIIYHSLASGQITGREQSPAHQQKIGLKIKLVLEKAEEPEIKLPTSPGSWKKQESSRKTSISALLTLPKPLTVWITINWKILKEMGIQDDLTCLLRNLYAGQEATVRTLHGTTDWF